MTPREAATPREALARRLLLRSRQAEIARRAALYATHRDRAAVERHQLDAVNRVWASCLRDVPFYRAWAAEHDLPPRISSLAELAQFPTLTKRVVLEREREIFQDGAIVAAYSSGGTTGTPARYPRGPQDTLGSYADTYCARGWWGLRPFDAYTHLWGHAHLFAGGRVVQARRAVADRLVNARRLDAYDLSEEAMARHLRAMKRQDPVYLVGYTSAVFRLARYVESLGRRPRLRRLRAVVVTAETVSASDVALIGASFGVPVVIEYGSSETGTLATSRGDSWPLQVLWTGCVLQLDDQGSVHVTTTNDRLFPLVRYALGDHAEPGDVVGGNALTLARVLGRQQDVVRLRRTDGRPLELSAILLVHILKLQPGVTGVQFRQEPDRLEVRLVAPQPLDLAAAARDLTRAIRLDHPQFDERSVTFRRITAPVLTLAGKQALLVPDTRTDPA